MTVNEVVDYLLSIKGNNSEVDEEWLSKLNAFYNFGGDINTPTNRYGWQLIHIAALNRLSNCAKWLVENGADINAVDNQGCTPLLLAFDSEIDSAVQYREDINFLCSKSLVAIGADIKVRDSDGKSLEDIATSYGRKILADFKDNFKS